MAAAEARAVWQRTANRYFVQEDAKRAPKLACCQSSSSSSKQADSSPTNAANVNEHPAVGFMPFNRNHFYSNLPPDTTHMRWWLQMQSSYGPEKGLTDDQLHALEDEVDRLKAEINSPSKLSGVNLQDAQSDSGIDRERSKTGCSIDSTDLLKSYEFLEMESFECSVSKKTNDCCYNNFLSSWVESGKAEPWWRTTDKDELASLVAQKSLDLIENCDLPPPQKMPVRSYSHACSDSFNSDEMTSLAWKSQASAIPSPIVNAWGHGGPMSSDLQENMQCASDVSFSTNPMNTKGQVSGSDRTKAQLLEALRHSQTRAREAESAAKQANAEKEHVIKLLLKQASQLFAYKQWFQILQLESLYVQIKNNEQPVSSIFPVAFPWIPNNSKKLRKSSQKVGKSKQQKQGQPRPDITKYAVAIALGMSLVGAGLLLGWTVGWMFPF